MAQDLQLQQLRDEAMTKLVMWASSCEYSPDIEATLKRWAATFDIPESELHNRLLAAADGNLARPAAGADGAAASPAAAQAAGGQQEPAQPPGAPATPAAAQAAGGQQQPQQPAQPASAPAAAGEAAAAAPSAGSGGQQQQQ